MRRAAQQKECLEIYRRAWSEDERMQDWMSEYCRDYDSARSLLSLAMCEIEAASEHGLWQPIYESHTVEKRHASIVCSGNTFMN